MACSRRGSIAPVIMVRGRDENKRTLPTRSRWTRSLGHDARAESWPVRDYRWVDVQVLRHQFGWGVLKEIRQGEFFKVGCSEDGEKLHVGVTDVLHVMSVVARGVADIAGIEIH